MTGVEAVAVTLLPLRKSAHAAIFPQVIEACPSSGQQLMRIGLMAHIPDHLILREVKCQMHGHGQLHHTQIRCKVSAGLTERPDQKITDFLCQLLTFRKKEGYPNDFHWL